MFFCEEKYLSIYMREPKQNAEGCVIWMHGLGASAQDMMGLANELPLSPSLRHVFLDAPVRPVTLNGRLPMRAWYDIVGMNLTDREDHVGILESETLIREVLEKQLLEGFASETIFLAGFSQGAAMALFTGMRTDETLGGIIALSGYLPLASQASVKPNCKTPVFVGSGEYDATVLPAWTGMSVTHLREQGYQQVLWNRYPMEHTICAEEIHDLGLWMANALKPKEAK